MFLPRLSIKRFTLHNRVMSTKQPIPSLLSTDWLASHLRDTVVLDGSWHLNKARDAKKEFEGKRLPASRFFDIDKVSDTSSSLPHMLPSAQDFSKHMSEMGISNDDHIVVYDSVGFGPACRVYWTFKAFGHERVSVLNGGLVKWESEKRPVESGPVSEKNASYNATLNPAIVKNYQEIQTALSQKSTQILDARPAGRFSGKEPEPRTGISSGHMPLSISLPFPDLVDPTTKTLLPKDKLFALFQSKKVDLSQPIICSCGSGITAAVIYVALEQVGAASVSVYDGSWAEYASLPTSVIVKD